MRYLISWLAALSFFLPLAVPASAQEFPNRPVTIIVPYPPGGAVDGVARVLAAELSEVTGKPFIIENRGGGAGGVVGSTEAVKAAPDGYTLLLNASIHVASPLINKNVSFNIVDDFSHIGLVAGGPLIITTNPKIKASTLKEFFDLVAADPDAFNFATSGYGSAGHLALEVLKLQAGIDSDVIAYKGGGPALNDMIGGQVQLLADPILSSLPHVKSGRLKALALTSYKRSALVPDIPTVEESGMPAMEMLSWYALWAPKGLDPQVASYLEKSVQSVVTSPKFREKMAVFGFEPMYKDAAGLKAFVIEEGNRYEQIVKAAKIKVE